MPFLPIRLFKEYELISVERSKIIKTMTSSGTSGQSVSKIFLDKDTATNQMKALVKIISSITGKKRLPLMVIDTNASVNNRKLFSARGAGILGFSMLGRDVTFALNEEMQIQTDIVRRFCDKYMNETILLFGFTSIIWENFYKQLKLSEQPLSFENAIMLHGGGWKRMLEQSVSNEEFKRLLKDIFGIQRVYNYYGMVEQTGSIFIECEQGYLHCPIFSDIIIRRADFSVCSIGEKGIVELVSLLPRSYPGHIILTEDVGEIVGEDNCSCGRLGKYFKIHGRIQNAEIRGCSDAYRG